MSNSVSVILQKSIAKPYHSCYNTLVSGCRAPLNIGMSPSGKAPDFDSGIRRFKSCHPSQYDPLAQSVEQLPFKQWVRGSNPRRVTRKPIPERVSAFCICKWEFEPIRSNSPVGCWSRGLTERNDSFRCAETQVESPTGHQKADTRKGIGFLHV